MPEAHDRGAEQVTLHWSPAQVTSPAQLSPPSQRIRLIPAALLMVDPQDEASAQVTAHSLPPHRIGPAQELAWLQVIVQALDCEQSMPPWQPKAPQLTWQGCSGGQTTAVLHAPGVLRQSNVQAVGEYCPPALMQRDSGVTGGGPSMGAPPLPVPPLPVPPLPMPPVPTAPPVLTMPPVEGEPPLLTAPPVKRPPVPVAPPVLGKLPVPMIPPVVERPPDPVAPPTLCPPSNTGMIPPAPTAPPAEIAPPA